LIFLCVIKGILGVRKNEQECVAWAKTIKTIRCACGLYVFASIALFLHTEQTSPSVHGQQPPCVNYSG